MDDGSFSTGGSLLLSIAIVSVFTLPSVWQSSVSRGDLSFTTYLLLFTELRETEIRAALRPTLDRMDVRFVDWTAVSAADVSSLDVRFVDRTTVSVLD